jgi:hypothetical protein
MSIHWVKIIESGHLSTQRLFELGLSFALCRNKRRWPSLETMNSFLRGGTDGGALATDIEWEPCELTQTEYEHAVAGFMNGEAFTTDTASRSWEDWISEISDENPVNKRMQ